MFLNLNPGIGAGAEAHAGNDSGDLSRYRTGETTYPRGINRSQTECTYTRLPRRALGRRGGKFIGFLKLFVLTFRSLSGVIEE